MKDSKNGDFMGIIMGFDMIYRIETSCDFIGIIMRFNIWNDIQWSRSLMKAFMTTFSFKRAENVKGSANLFNLWRANSSSWVEHLCNGFVRYSHWGFLLAIAEALV